jgi:hypothetical protein
MFEFGSQDGDRAGHTLHMTFRPTQTPDRGPVPAG